jgi:hypothetical protein
MVPTKSRGCGSKTRNTLNSADLPMTPPTFHRSRGWRRTYWQQLRALSNEASTATLTPSDLPPEFNCVLCSSVRDSHCRSAPERATHHISFRCPVGNQEKKGWTENPRTQIKKGQFRLREVHKPESSIFLRCSTHLPELWCPRHQPCTSARRPFRMILLKASE